MFLFSRGVWVHFLQIFLYFWLMECGFLDCQRFKPIGQEGFSLFLVRAFTEHDAVETYSNLRQFVLQKCLRLLGQVLLESS